MKTNITLQTTGLAPRQRGVSIDEYSDVLEVVVKQSTTKKSVKIHAVTAHPRYSIGTRHVHNIKFHFNKSTWNVKKLGHIFADTGFGADATDFIKSFAKTHNLSYLGASLAGYREQSESYVLMTVAIEGDDAAKKWLSTLNSELI